MVLVTVFSARLVYLQAINAPQLVREALAHRQVTAELTAHRGDITDVNGAVLATTVEYRNILVDQTLVSGYTEPGANSHDPPAGIAGAARVLAPVLNMGVPEVTKALTGSSLGAYVVRNVTPDVARAALRLNIPGLATEQASRRQYPNGNLASAVVGFLDAEGRPWGGVESSYQNQLAGINGSIVYEQAEDGTRIPTAVQEKNPTNGATVRLTIDRDIQWKAQQLAAAQRKSMQAESVQIVVMDPKSGQVLAMVSDPGFDPNHAGDSPAANQRNRAVLDGFEPGSTAKVMTIAAALEEKKITGPDEVLAVPHRLNRAGQSFRDSEEHPAKPMTIAQVMAESSNMGTILAGERLERATFERYLHNFGLGSITGVGLPESAGTLAPASQWSDSQRYTVMFGQGLSVTAIQAAQVFATLANDGVRVAPSVIAGHTDSFGTYHPREQRPGIQVVSAATAASVRAMMEGVVHEGGTAVKAAIPGYRVAGKTGTANRYDNKCQGYCGYTSSFIGMAPADNPALVAAVIVDNPQRSHFGGEVAAPVFQQLMAYSLSARGIAPSAAS